MILRSYQSLIQLWLVRFKNWMLLLFIWLSFIGFWFLFIACSALEEPKTKKVLVRHVETVTSSEATIDVLEQFVVGNNFHVFSAKPYTATKAVFMSIFCHLCLFLVEFAVKSYWFFLLQKTSRDATEGKNKSEERRLTFKKDNVISLSFLPTLSSWYF